VALGEDAGEPPAAIGDQHPCLPARQHALNSLVDGRRLGEADGLGGGQDRDRVVEQGAAGCPQIVVETRGVLVLELTSHEVSPSKPIVTRPSWPGNDPSRSRASGGLRGLLVNIPKQL